MKNILDIFGSNDAKEMPDHFFWNAIKIDYDTAIRAKIKKQNYSVCAREWYIDAHFECMKCGREYVWTTSEQKAWFEDFYFWVDSSPNNCKECRKEIRELKEARSQYDQIISEAREGHDLDAKKKALGLIERIENGTNLPEKIKATKDLLQKQILKAEQGGAGQRR